MILTDRSELSPCRIDHDAAFFCRLLDIIVATHGVPGIERGDAATGYRCPVLLKIHVTA